MKVPLTEIDEGVEHSEAVVILANIEAFVMELVHSSIVTVKPGDGKITICKEQSSLFSLTSVQILLPCI